MDRTTGAYQWMEHRQFFTTNPSLVPRRIIDLGWPEGERSEAAFNAWCIDHDPTAAAGLWGRRDDEPLAHHAGGRHPQAFGY